MKRRKKRYNLWSDRSFRESGPREKWQDKDAKVVWSTWQYTWEDACQAHCTHEGWGRYRPLWEDVSGACWDGYHKSKCPGKRLDELKECGCECHKRARPPSTKEILKQIVRERFAKKDMQKR